MKALKTPCYNLVRPTKKTIPLLVDAPHSGGVLPDDFDFICDLADLRQSDEFYVDRFAGYAVPHGGTFLKANISRAYIDLNRPISDIHPDLCADPIPWPLTRSRRVMYGIGLIRHLVRPFEPVYGRQLSVQEIEERIRHYYDPYYDVLGTELQNLRYHHGRVLHVDLHSMPNIGVDGLRMPDIVLGDHDGHSCGRIYRDMLKSFFEDQGLRVALNQPYKGVELTRRFAKPRQGIHCLQLEINKSLFMDEKTLAPHNGIDDVEMLFKSLWRHVAEMMESLTVAQAAE